MTDSPEPVASPEPAARMPLRVRYHECDPQGVVFNAHYLAYADMASFEYLKALFGSHTELVERGVDLVVAESNVRYLAACRFDDELAVAVFTQRIGTTSLVLRFEIRRGAELVTEITNRYAWVDTQTLRPAPPPDDVRETLTRSVPS
ncbi:acyl-CoA thioester hydrolase [Halopolyspora algeriensis]|uniref:Acyl-CoA thioester hydrolase n=1 Tax=Halopolyspora algeriensis TaxID=1500506 RepID=A0A368W2N8_9ACTN|nr:thioesterase family protein [Halopolyspora algeriensis]RCW46953.1 acyl-CoA thioester hydrolase [Halopolyspora algeriensis]TQM48044.1 acyl-CoA thioester hydrolase [Halopolyspora algeriensis]